MNNNLVYIFCLIYVIVYLVISIYQKPNFEFFYSYQENDTNISDINTNSIEGFDDQETDQKLMDEIKKAIENSKLELKEQQIEQEKQNKKIKELKAFITQAREDLMIHRNKEHKEMTNVHSQMDKGESLTQVMSSSNGLKGYGNAGSEGNTGNSYHLNFNLENE
jgi:hypothetical protein